MSNVYISANADGVGEQIGAHISQDNHEELSRVSGAIKSAQEMLNRWAESKGGQVIVSSGDESILSVPKQALAELKSIQNKYNQIAGATLTVGVGATMSESSKALIFGKISGDKGSVVHYDPSIDSQISGQDDDLADDSLPSEEGLEQDGVDGDMEESGLADDPEAAGIDDGNGDENNNEDEFSDEAEVGDEQAEQSLQEDNDILDDESGEDFDPSQPEHEQGMSEEENFAHDADENQEDELDEDNIEADEEGQEFDPSQPPHEQDMSDEENFSHDAEENEDDEQDADNIEADEEENTFGGNTEPEDEDFVEDAAEDVAAQDLDDEGSEEFAENDENQDGLPDDPETFDMDNDGDIDAIDDGMEQDAIQDLGEEDIAQQGEESPQSEEDQDGSVMTDMLHANIGDEESEDSDDEVKQDVIESLMSFKQNKEHLEQLKETNPEMYQANIMMLRAMIQMAKKLKMNPDAGMEDADNVKAANEQFPDADPNVEVEEDNQEALPNPQDMGKKPFGKSEINKSSRIDSVSTASQRHNRRKVIPEGGQPKQKGVHNEHAPKMHEKQAPRGQSDAGVAARASVKSNRPVDKEVGNKPARQAHLKVITEQKQMKRPNLAESERNSVKGVHKPYMKPGESLAGELGREAKKNPKSIMGQANKDVAINQHKQKLGELKNIKPNLPKSEKDSVKGVHPQAGKKTTQSPAGMMNTMRNISPKRSTSAEHMRDGQVSAHKKVLAEQKQMPRPNLPKSEGDSVSSFKQGSRVVHNVHGAGTVAGSHGEGIHSVNFDSVSDRNVKPTKVHEKNFQQKQAQKPMQKPMGKSEKQTVEQMNLDLKKKKAKTGKK